LNWVVGGGCQSFSSAGDLGLDRETYEVPTHPPKEVDMGWKIRKRDHNTKDKTPFNRKKEIKNIPQTQEDVLVEDVRIIGKRRERDHEKIKTLAAHRGRLR
jgi:hypothetical protein